MWIIICLIGIAVLFYACFVLSGKYDREEEREHPCDTCLRWSECNGVDENCQVTNKSKNIKNGGKDE